MMNMRFLGTLGALTAVLAGCGSASNDFPGAAGATSFTGGGSGPTPGGGGASGTTSPGTGGSGGDPSTCVPGIPATTQIPRLLNRQYDAAVRDLLGVTTLTSEAGKKPSDLLFADFDGAMLPDAWHLYQTTAATIAHEVMTGANKSKFIACDPTATGCLDQTIKSFGRKAFRRALTDAEVARFQKLSQTTPAGTPAEVAETTLLAFLVSPSFILLPELSATQDPSGLGIQLSSFEVATRLSILLWGSVPDDVLNAAADANQLTTKDQILAQATRMIAVREKTGPLVASFHRHWAQMDNANGHWWKIDHDTTKYPLYSADAKPTFQAELDAFFQEIAFGGGSFADFFTSNVAFVNKDNAAIYGLDPAGYGTELKRVELDAAQRPGFLTRVGFLSSYSHFADTSPILRGAFITINLLGVDPGPPLAGATMMQAPPGDYKTNRQYTDALTSPAACQGCHVALINPLGYSLENYDSIGKWQTVDALGGPIDSTANVTFSSTNTKPISSPAAFMQEIAATPKAKQIYAQGWVSYAFGRPANANDTCVVNQLNMKLAQSGYTVLNLLSDLTQADTFRMRVRATP